MTPSRSSELAVSRTVSWPFNASGPPYAGQVSVLPIVGEALRQPNLLPEHHLRIDANGLRTHAKSAL